MPKQDDDFPSPHMTREELMAERFARVREKFRSSTEGFALSKYLTAASAVGIQPPPEVVYGDIRGSKYTNAPNAEGQQLGGMYGTTPTRPGGIVAIHENQLGTISGLNTMTHEMVHAAQDRMGKQVNNPKYTSPQFKKAYRTLGLDSAALAKAVSSNWVKSDRAATGSLYRTTAPEIAAFGVGNSIVPQAWRDTGAVTHAAPPHMDATAAQEFMILLDLATRNLRQGLNQPNKK